MDDDTRMSGIKDSAADYDRKKELEAFNNTKAGIKGLVDAGIKNIPKIFIRSPDELADDMKTCRSRLQAPVIDLSGINIDYQLKKIVSELRQASEEWGVFQVVNHGIPVSVLDGMIGGIHKFHEQDAELKRELYSCDVKKKVRCSSNTEIYKTGAACWRDTLSISLQVEDHVHPDELPPACRNTTIEFVNHVTQLGETLLTLYSEALGVKKDHLIAMECARGRQIVGHYYPPCPEPELTLGANKHTDTSFLTIVLQDQSGGLQVLHDNQWCDVQPIAGALIVNVGDFFQIISNDKFRSVEHRVVANKAGPKISAACFFMGGVVPPKIYSPIEELISEANPLKYKEFSVLDYFAKFVVRERAVPVLHQFKLG